MIKTTNLHFTSKRLFMFMLKMCIRRLAAEVTKSMAGGSSWRQQEGWKKCLNGHSFKDKLLVINTCISPPPPSILVRFLRHILFALPCPKLARLLLPSPAAVSGESPRCAGTSGRDPKHSEPAGPLNRNLELRPVDMLGYTKSTEEH